MREIKFRAWDKEMCHFIEHDELFETGPDYQNPFTRTDIVMLQFTGLTDNSVDKNEIYAKDILYTEQMDGSTVQQIFVDVFYQNGAFRILWPGEDESIVLTDKVIDANHLVLAGNVMQNPELLEDK